MTGGILFGFFLILIGCSVLSSGFINKGVQLRRKISKSQLFPAVLIVILAILIFLIVYQTGWDETLWKLVFVFFLIFGLLQLLSIYTYPNFFEGISSFLENPSFFKRLLLFIAFFSLGLLLVGRSYIEPVPVIDDCESDSELNVLCVVKNPEDIAVTPDNNFLIISEFGGIEPLEEMVPGNLSLINLESLEASTLSIVYSDKKWGEDSCNRNESSPFGPHGIDLIERDDGRWQLAVVDHISEESIEMFELVYKGNKWSLEWKGCIKPSADKYLNDVSLKSDGSFFVTHMYDRHSTITDFLAIALFKYDTGHVMYWEPEVGLKKVNNSEGSMPNGIAYDQINDTLYVNFNLGNKLTAIRGSTGEFISSISLNSPDNLYLKDDSIWVTTLDHEILDVALGCGSEFDTTCPLPFSVFELESSNLTIKSKKSFKETVFGLPTVAVPVKNKIWLGSFNSNRIAFYYF